MEEILTRAVSPVLFLQWVKLFITKQRPEAQLSSQPSCCFYLLGSLLCSGFLASLDLAILLPLPTGCSVTLFSPTACPWKQRYVSYRQYTAERQASLRIPVKLKLRALFLTIIYYWIFSGWNWRLSLRRNQEKEPEAHGLLGCCGWPWLSWPLFPVGCPWDPSNGASCCYHSWASSWCGTSACPTTMW